MSDLKFLVADDELVSRNKMVAILSGWGECVSCDGGKEAILTFCSALKNKTPFHFVSLDIDMPDIEGKIVLAKMRQYEKEQHVPTKASAKIVMVTSHRDRENVQLSLKSGCDNYVLKPFNVESIEKVLKGLALLSAPQQAPDITGLLTQEIIQAIEKLNKGLLNLPSPPEVYTEFKAMVEDGTNLDCVESLLRNHGAITGKLINISNTSIYRGVNKNESIKDAVARLGVNEALRQVCAICTHGMFLDASERYRQYSEDLYKASMDFAYCCELLSRYLCKVYNFDTFTLGLLYNIGAVVLLGLVDGFESKLDESQHLESKDITELVDKYAGLFGAALLKHWEMSSAYQQVAKHCYSRERLTRSREELQLFSLARDLVEVMNEGRGKEALAEIIEYYESVFETMEVEGLMDVINEVKTAVSEANSALS